MLGVSAARQIASKMNTSEREQLEMVAKLERSCKKLDHANRGALTINEYWNICRVQNRINVSKDEVKHPFNRIIDEENLDPKDASFRSEKS